MAFGLLGILVKKNKALIAFNTEFPLERSRDKYIYAKEVCTRASTLASYPIFFHTLWNIVMSLNTALQVFRSAQNGFVIHKDTLLCLG